MNPGSACLALIITRQHDFSSTVKEKKNSGGISVDEYTADFKKEKKNSGGISVDEYTADFKVNKKTSK